MLRTLSTKLAKPKKGKFEFGGDDRSEFNSRNETSNSKISSNEIKNKKVENDKVAKKKLSKNIQV